MKPTLDDVKAYFSDRTPKYDRSSSWVSDEALGQRMRELLAVAEGDRVLDVASGTGFLGKVLAPTGASVVGLDYTPAMMESSTPYYAELVTADAHAMPFDDDSFDAVVSRQGIQFMDAPVVVREMARVVKPGGRVLLMHLAAYGGGDEEETFEIQRLRNPVRRNFFEADDQPDLLRDAGLEVDVIEPYHTVESALNWLGCGSIPEDRIAAAMAVYASASPAFRELHDLRRDGDDFLDRMLFIIARGIKR